MSRLAFLSVVVAAGRFAYDLGHRRGWKKAPRTIFANNTIYGGSSNAAVRIEADGIHIPRGTHVIGNTMRK